MFGRPSCLPLFNFSSSYNKALIMRTLDYYFLKLPELDHVHPGMLVLTTTQSNTENNAQKNEAKQSQRL